jgi:hypothetical protein
VVVVRSANPARDQACRAAGSVKARARRRRYRAAGWQALEWAETWAARVRQWPAWADIRVTAARRWAEGREADRGAWAEECRWEAEATAVTAAASEEEQAGLEAASVVVVVSAEASVAEGWVVLAAVATAAAVVDIADRATP